AISPRSPRWGYGVLGRFTRGWHPWLLPVTPLGSTSPSHGGRAFSPCLLSLPLPLSLLRRGGVLRQRRRVHAGEPQRAHLLRLQVHHPDAVGVGVRDVQLAG